MSSINNSTMIQRVTIKSFGDASHVELETFALEAPTSKHVQVAISYSGFNGSDINMRQGTYPMQKAAPLTPGYCIVGRVLQNGQGCSAFKGGDVVASLTVYDGEAERANIPEKHLVPVPDGLDHKQACALILDWNTAYGMVMQTAKVSSGQRVFIHGMTGAVGFATMKLAQLQGAEVYGTAGERNHDAIRKEGGKPFTYKNKDWMQAMKDVGSAHAVFDPLGFESWDESYSILHDHEKSILIGYAGNQGRLTGDEKTRSVIWPTLKLYSKNMMIGCPRSTSFYYIARDQSTFRPNLEKLFEMHLQGQIIVPIRKVWKLKEVPAAHKEYEGGLTGVGSLIVDCAVEPTRVSQ